MTTILAVDDSATMRKCLEITFAGTEFNLVSCDSAVAALEKIKTLQPHLVIADVSLPPGDGYELCTTIKLAQPTLPVLMLTSKHNPFDAQRGALADDHIDKPFDSQVLQDKARELIKEKPVGDTDIPKSFGDRPAAALLPGDVVDRARALSQPRVVAGSQEPPPRRRATPAMMVSPVQEGRRPLPGMDPLARRTVPFAVPPTAHQTDMVKTTPGVQPDASDGVARKRAKRDLSKTMAFGRMDADSLRRQGGAPRQAGARKGPQPPQPGADVIGTAPFEEKLPVATPRVKTATPAALASEAAAPRSADRRAGRDTVDGWPAPSEIPPGHVLPGKTLPETPLAAAAAAAGNGAAMAAKLEVLGLSAEQIQGVLALSREVVEQVVWEVVPALAETLIKEEIRRLTKE